MSANDPEDDPEDDPGDDPGDDPFAADPISDGNEEVSNLALRVASDVSVLALRKTQCLRKRAPPPTVARAR